MQWLDRVPIKVQHRNLLLGVLGAGQFCPQRNVVSGLTCLSTFGTAVGRTLTGKLCPVVVAGSVKIHNSECGALSDLHLRLKKGTSAGEAGLRYKKPPLCQPRERYIPRQPLLWPLVEGEAVPFCNWAWLWTENEVAPFCDWVWPRAVRLLPSTSARTQRANMAWPL